jgi:hypothetical protein
LPARIYVRTIRLRRWRIGLLRVVRVLDRAGKGSDEAEG